MSVSLPELKAATYCPDRDQYRTGDAVASDHPEERRSLAFRYPQLVTAEKPLLAELPIGVPPGTYRHRLRQLRSRSVWSQLTDPADTDRPFETRDCHGTVPKVLESPTRPVLVSASRPPAHGVWRAQEVAAVAATAGLQADREETVDRAVIEYPGHGVVRSISITPHHRRRYQQALQRCNPETRPSAGSTAMTQASVR